MAGILRMKLIAVQQLRGDLRTKYTIACDSYQRELILEIERLQKQMEKLMDKQINKVKKDVEKGNKAKAKKDIKKLLVMDKKMDKKVDRCDSMMGKKKR